MPAPANPQPVLAPSSSAEGAGLNVIALVSGGKDSFFSVLHCLANGHRVVALANLHPQMPVPGTQGRRSGDPGTPAATPATVEPRPGGSATDSPVSQGNDPEQGAHTSAAALQRQDPRSIKLEVEVTEDQDLNSFMYQTVGHQVIPLYAEATGIPLYRQPIIGGAAQSGKDYSGNIQASRLSGATEPRATEPAKGIVPAAALAGLSDSTTATPSTPAEPTLDETESMVPLLLAVKAAHPEANAVCAGAILSTYQRTRVESVATRLGLTPLAYLWKYPVLPSTADPSDLLADAQLLRDMAAVGLDVRIVKVATGGLDDSFLWTNLATVPGMARVARGMRRFMAAEQGAVLGEGGEFETLVVDGPSRLFRKRIRVEDSDRQVVHEGGNNAWLQIVRASIEEKEEHGATDAAHQEPRRPALLDRRFQDSLDSLSEDAGPELGGTVAAAAFKHVASDLHIVCPAPRLMHWCVVGEASSRSSIKSETESLVANIRALLQRTGSLEPSAIVNTTILLRSMKHFPEVNGIYGGLFTEPNPPSRVTISCGDGLPKDCNIVVYLTVHPSLEQGQRKGLHVQSRSYWAPANIGPYSQAISLPLDSLATQGSSLSGAELAAIAGQIPLIPASMELPSGANTLELELVLSLQHLWRIGLDIGVQWWSSVMAFFPRSTPEAMPRKARLAAKVWEAAHRWSTGTGEDEEDEASTGPDLWDRRHNAAYMVFGGDEDASPPSLPDWSVMASIDEDSPKPVPPFFAAEVEELPRSAGVEWHAHQGFARLAGESVFCKPSISTETAASVSSVAVKSSKGTTALFHTFSWNMEETAKYCQKVSSRNPSSVDIVRGSLPGPEGSEIVPIIQYLDTSILDMPAYGSGGEGVPTVPCFSLWDGHGERLGLVVVYQSIHHDGRPAPGTEEDEQ